MICRWEYIVGLYWFRYCIIKLWRIKYLCVFNVIKSMKYLESIILFHIILYLKTYIQSWYKNNYLTKQNLSIFNLVFVSITILYSLYVQTKIVLMNHFAAQILIANATHFMKIAKKYMANNSYKNSTAKSTLSPILKTKLLVYSIISNQSWLKFKSKLQQQSNNKALQKPKIYLSNICRTTNPLK